MRAWWLGLLAIVVGACRFNAAGAPTDGDLGTPTDDSPPPPVDAAALGPWGAPVLVAELSSASHDDDPTLTADLLEVYFASDRAIELTSEDLYVARRSAPTDPFGTPELVVELSSAALDSNVDISADGLTIVFTSERAGDADLYIATRPDRASAWGTPVLAAGLNSSAGEWGAVLGADGLRAVLCSDRGPNEAIYAAVRTAADQPFDAPVKLAELDTSANECDAMLPDPRTIYFTRDSAAAGIDLYLATSSDGLTFGAPQPIPELDTASRDGDPWVSPDQRTMYFASNRAGGAFDDIYISTR